MAYPELGDNHQIFGTEYCSEFTDISGNWNNGFYCPKQPESPLSTVACCGTYIYKYCCVAPVNSTLDTIATTEIYQVPVSENLYNYQFLVTIVTAFLLLCVIIVIPCVYCYQSSYCLYWRKQWNDTQQNRDLANRSTVIYSIPNDCELDRQGQVLPTSFPTQFGFFNENNNCASAFQNPPNYASIYPNYQPIHEHLAAGQGPDRIGETTVQYSSSESIPLTLSDSGLYSNGSSNCSSNASTTTAIIINPNRPLTLVNIRNNYAYITSAVPLTDLLKSEVTRSISNRNQNTLVSTQMNRNQNEGNQNLVPDTCIAIEKNYNQSNTDSESQN